MTSAYDTTTFSLEYTFWPTPKLTAGKRQSATLEQLAELHLKTVRAADNLPLIGLALYPGDSRKAGAIPTAFTGVALDYDAGDLPIDVCVAQLKKLNLMALVHETRKSSPTKPRLRVLLPFHKPLDELGRMRTLNWLRTRVHPWAKETEDNMRNWFIGHPKDRDSSAQQIAGFPIDVLAWSAPKMGGFSREYERAKCLELGDGAYDYFKRLAMSLANTDFDVEEELRKEDDTWFDGYAFSKHEKDLMRAIKGALKKSEPKQAPPPEQYTPVTPIDEDDPYRFAGYLDDLFDIEFPPVEWVVQDLLPPGLCLLAGPPKAGKSRFNMQLGLCVASGVPFLGQAVSQGAVVYLSLEDPMHLSQERAKATAKKVGITKRLGKNFYITATWDNGLEAVTRAKEMLVRMVAEDDLTPRLLIIDVLQRIRDGKDSRKPQYEVDYEQLKPWAELRRDFPTLTILITHHTRKAEVEDPFDAISGTQGLAGSVDSLLMLRRPGKDATGGDNHEEVKDRLLFYVRSRYRRTGDFEAVLKSEPDLITLTTEKPWELASAWKQVALRKLMETNATKMWTSTELHALLDDNTKIGTTKQTLKLMEKRGWVIGHHGEGYTLVDQAVAKF